MPLTSSIIFSSQLETVEAGKKKKKKEENKGKKSLRPDSVGSGAYCMGCKYMLQNAHEYLKKRISEADVLEYLEKMCNQEEFEKFKDNIHPFAAHEACEALVANHEDMLIRLLKFRWNGL